MQNLKYLFLFAAVLCTAQTFNYHRDWGTYLGGVNGRMGRLFEAKSNIVLDGVVKTGNISPVPIAGYYDQFVTPNEKSFQFGVNPNNINFYVSKISSDGSAVQSYGYRTSPVIHRDKDGNYFKIVDSGTPTAGAWLSAGVETGTGSFYNRLLEKYDANDNLLWRTYTPHMNFSFEYTNSDEDCLITDTAGNIYIKGKTQWQSLGDAGTAFPNIYNNSCNFVVKLNPLGQKIWATYIPSGDTTNMHFCVFSNNLYLSTRCVSSSPIAATPGAFQTFYALNAILNLNASTGALQWCTFYEAPNVTYSSVIRSIAADEDGLYVLGFLNSSYLYNTYGYYAGSGAYQAQQPGFRDWYLAKFGSQGERIWGTYYGSPYDDVYNSSISGDAYVGNLDVKNGKILLTHLQNGDSNMATPGAYLSVKPQDVNYDIVFSMFDTNGNRLFTSYYGGSIPNAGNEALYVYGQFSNKSDAFYIYGLTTSQNGYTQNAIQNSIIYPSSTFTYSPYVGFLTKFVVNPLLSAQEAAKHNDLQLFDNPNKGAFSLKGSLLAKEQCRFTIYDAWGRMLADKTMGKTETQYFNLSQLLSEGNYILTVKNNKNELVKTFKMTVK